MTQRFTASELPTPVHELKHLSRLLAGPRLLIKRDDLTPFGGSKYRKALTLVGEALAARVTRVVTQGSIESQHARSIAIAAKRRGLACTLVVSPEKGDDEEPTLLDNPEGASLVCVNHAREREAQVMQVARRLEEEGDRVRIIPFSGTSPSTTVAYVDAFRELQEQMEEVRGTVDAIFVSSATGGIQAGLELGKRLSQRQKIQIKGISPGLDYRSLQPRILDLMEAGASYLRRSVTIAREEILVYDEFVGAGYLHSTAESREARRLLHNIEGIWLDPVYTAKAMAALIQQVRRGCFSPSDSVLFWNTCAPPARVQ